MIGGGVKLFCRAASLGVAGAISGVSGCCDCGKLVSGCGVGSASGIGADNSGNDSSISLTSGAMDLD